VSPRTKLFPCCLAENVIYKRMAGNICSRPFSKSFSQ
jgi:hypothetical protein